MLPRWRLVGGASQPEVVAFDSISVDFVAVLNKMYRFFFLAIFAIGGDHSRRFRGCAAALTSIFG